ALCYHNLSTNADLESLPERLAMLRRSFDLRVQLVVDFPQVMEYSQWLRSETRYLGALLCENSRCDEVEPLVRQVEDLWRRLFASFPDQRQYVGYLAECFQSLGLNLEQAGWRADAENYYRK